jgi:hypothetical protein
MDVENEIVDYSKCPRCGHLMVLYEVQADSTVLQNAKPPLPSAPVFGQKQEKKSRKRSR